LPKGSEIEANWDELYWQYREAVDGTLVPILRIAAGRDFYDYIFLVPQQWNNGRKFTMVQINPDFEILYIAHEATRPVGRANQPPGLPLVPTDLVHDANLLQH
jgi:hypothetical protein